MSESIRADQERIASYRTLAADLAVENVEARCPGGIADWQEFRATTELAQDSILAAMEAERR